VVGQIFTRVTISFVKKAGSRPVFFMIELTNATVQDMTLGADAIGQTAEEVSFSFQIIKLTDIVIDPTGKQAGTVVVVCDFTRLRCT
jgi:type VI protein secretion system component Hcp